MTKNEMAQMLRYLAKGVQIVYPYDGESRITASERV